MTYSKIIQTLKFDIEASLRVSINNTTTNVMPPCDHMTAIDLFCGAGGLSEGFRQAGFHILAGQDINIKAGETFSTAHPNAKFISGPIENVTPQQLLKAAGAKRGDIDVILGGPPGQGYSVYDHQRSVDDPRSQLFNQYLRIVKGIMPRWLVMENVIGLLSIDSGRLQRSMLEEINKLGYQVELQIVKAEEFGVPQRRHRIFIVGTRTDSKFSYPRPTRGPGLLPFVTLWDAISDLSSLRAEADDQHSYPKRPQNSYQALLRGNCNVITNHSAPRLSRINRERLAYIPPGGSWRNIPLDLLPVGMLTAKRSDHTKRYGRPKKTDLSCAILTKCDPHWGAYFHPAQQRSFTVREAARIQSFPDRFNFCGNRTEQYVQVGNAVPPLLAKSIATSILLAEARKTSRLLSHQEIAII